jgi:hypothetical protein
VAVRECGIDAVAGADQVVRGHDVGGGKAEPAPPPIALHDRALEKKRRAQAPGRRLDLPGRDERPDSGRGDDLAVDLDQGHDAGIELLARGEQLGVAPRPGAEAKVLPHRDVGGAELLDQDSRTEILGRDRGEVPIEGDYD